MTESPTRRASTRRATARRLARGLAFVCVAALAALGLGVALVPSDRGAGIGVDGFVQPVQQPWPRARRRAADSDPATISIVNNITPSGNPPPAMDLRPQLHPPTRAPATSSTTVRRSQRGAPCNGSDNVGGSTTILRRQYHEQHQWYGPPAAGARSLISVSARRRWRHQHGGVYAEHARRGPSSTQCNGSGNGGGGGMNCTASGTVSIAVPRDRRPVQRLGERWRKHGDVQHDASPPTSSTRRPVPPDRRRRPPPRLPGLPDLPGLPEPPRRRMHPRRRSRLRRPHRR